ncbi:MAG: type II toxin-antitoxin system VapC family toxin [Deltaproteobacteria bacterium]|nr:type II toxin-antitoxin system VapC family toxin [Deltaproteobacteria bacterium]
MKPHNPSTLSNSSNPTDPAIATVHGIDYLMTWNCVHLANATITKTVARVCRQEGFECPVICTPEELLGE